MLSPQYLVLIIFINQIIAMFTEWRGERTTFDIMIYEQYNTFSKPSEPMLSLSRNVHMNVCLCVCLCVC